MSRAGLWALVALCLCACKTNFRPDLFGDQPTTYRLGSETFQILTGDNLLIHPNAVGGQGRILFVDPLPEGNLKVETQGFLEDRGTLWIHLGTDDGLSGGVDLRLERRGLAVALTVSHGTESKVITPSLPATEGDRELNLVWELKPKEQKAVLWTTTVNPTSFPLPRTLKGRRWGATFLKSTLVGAGVGPLGHSAW